MKLSFPSPSHILSLGFSRPSVFLECGLLRRNDITETYLLTWNDLIITEKNTLPNTTGCNRESTVFILPYQKKFTLPGHLFSISHLCSCGLECDIYSRCCCVYVLVIGWRPTSPSWSPANQIGLHPFLISNLLFLSVFRHSWMNNAMTRPMDFVSLTTYICRNKGPEPPAYVVRKVRLM